MVLYLFHVIIGFLVFISTIVMTLWFKTNRILNTYLIVISTVLCAYLILFGFEKVFNCIFFEYLNYYQVVLALTPATFLFFQKLIYNIKFPEKKDFWFFILPILLYFFVGKDFNFGWYREIQFIFYVFYLAFYLKIVTRLLRKHIWIDKQIDTFPQIVVNWASFIFRMMVALIFHFCIVLITDTFNIGNEYKVIIEFSLLIVFLIGYFKVISTPELLYGRGSFTNEKWVSATEEIAISSVWNLELNKKITAQKDAYLKNKINGNLKEYINGIEKVSIVDFSFRDRNYSLNDMSLELGLPKYYIAYVFKYHCDLNFNDYKRLVRVYDSIILIQQGYLKSNTLNSLAEFVGFSSYNPFLLSFKQVTGVSPFDYYKNRKVVNSQCSLN